MFGLVEMDQAGFSPNAETYATLLHACVEARNEEKVGAVLSDMTSKVCSQPCMTEIRLHI